MFKVKDIRFLVPGIFLALLLAMFAATGSSRGAEDAAGNNLSYPAIWSDGYPLALRGTFGAPVFNGPSQDIEGVIWYQQQHADNTWQAESADWSASPVDVDWVDWGDSLEARNWTLHSKVRVETSLLQDLTDPMTAFEMRLLEGSGATELWGTNTVQYDSAEAHVYSNCARLTIQKLNGDPAGLSLTWDPVTDEWIGDSSPALFNAGVWEGGEGPAGYTAEINGPGKVIYGYNWDTSAMNEGTGYYRLTFSLEDTECPQQLNTFFQTTQIKASEEGEASALAGPGGSGGAGGGVAFVDTANNLTYIDMQIAGPTMRPTRTPRGQHPSTTASQTPVRTHTPTPTATATGPTFTAGTSTVTDSPTIQLTPRPTRTPRLR